MTPMNFKRKWWTGACAAVGMSLSGLIALPAGAGDTAQTTDQPPTGKKPDAQLIRQRVQDALHADPYLYDKHITVSVEKNRIVLRGFVFSGWDLQNALRIAREASEGMQVIDNLSIKEGGAR